MQVLGGFARRTWVRFLPATQLPLASRAKSLFAALEVFAFRTATSLAVLWFAWHRFVARPAPFS
jgi:hypothetical protein